MESNTAKNLTSIERDWNCEDAPDHEEEPSEIEVEDPDDFVDSDRDGGE